MLYIFTILVAIMDSVLASGQPFIGCLMQKYNIGKAKSSVWKSAFVHGKIKANRCISSPPQKPII